MRVALGIEELLEVWVPGKGTIIISVAGVGFKKKNSKKSAKVINYPLLERMGELSEMVGPRLGVAPSRVVRGKK